MPIGEDTKLTASGAEGNYLSLTVVSVHVQEGLKRVVPQREAFEVQQEIEALVSTCLLYTSPSPRDRG